MKMQTTDYCYRKANASDDAALIAAYIHLTDPYIYPSICSDPADPNWIAFITECLNTPGNIFHFDHISVAMYQGRIVGIACVIPCGKQLNFAENIQTSNLFQDPCLPALSGYFSPLIAESKEFTGYNITNFCVDAQHRGKGVGSALMAHCISEYGDSPIHLDAVADNTAALRLYKNFGFQIETEYNGFSGNGEDLPCYHMLHIPGATNPPR